MKNIVKAIKLSFVVAGSLSILGSALIAKDLPNRGPIEFSSYDTNKDGFVSEQEFNDLRAIFSDLKFLITIASVLKSSCLTKNLFSLSFCWTDLKNE